jgi:type IV secretion system protein VirB10
MAENDSEEERLKARLTALKGPIKSKRRVNPFILAAISGIAGIGVGAYLVAFAPEPDQSAGGLPASTAREFQDGSGLDGFRLSDEEPAPLPQIAAPRDNPELDQLRATVARLENELAGLRANPDTVTVTDEASLKALRDQLSVVEAAAAARDEALSALQIENGRLLAQMEAASLLGDQASSEADAAARREEELARRRAAAEALREAQVNSEMVALRSSSGGDGADGSEQAGADTSRADGGDAAFLREGASRSEVQQSEVIANPANTIMQGTLIEAALETAISSDLAGNVAAQVSHDVWSFDMTQVLIPRGSKLFGRYDSDVGLGQRRVLIAWDRLVTSNGQSVELAAYGTDRIGRSGLPGKVRTHFLKRFGSATLISIIGAAPTLLAQENQSESADNVVKDATDNLNDAAGTVLGEYLTIAPTISIIQGAVVMVRVGEDIEMH